MRVIAIDNSTCIGIIVTVSVIIYVEPTSENISIGLANSKGHCERYNYNRKRAELDTCFILIRPK